MGSIFWWFLGLLALAVFAGSRKSKKQTPTPTRTVEVIDESPPLRLHQAAPVSQDSHATVDLEELLCKEPMWDDFKAQFDSDDWDQKRQFLQKIAYGIAAHPQREQDVFKLLMTVFAESDPLYRQCLSQVLPVVAATPGVKQTDLYAHITAAPDVELARYALYFAHELGEIIRVKKGNTYQVYPADKNHSNLIKIGLINRLGYGHKLPSAMQGIDIPATPAPAHATQEECTKPVQYVFQNDLPGDHLAAFYTVMSELQNTQLSVAQLAEISEPVIEALGDRRRAAKVLTASLAGTEWDWPAWYPYAKREGYPTIQQVLSERDPGPYELLKQMLKPELHATAQAFGVPAKKSATKDDIIPAMLQSGSPQLQPLLQELLTKHRAKRRHKIYLQVAEGVASRIDKVAYGLYRYKKMLDYAKDDPHFSHWLFTADSIHGNQPPKRCRDLHGTIRPWDKASTTFPQLPCKRLDCFCRISIGTAEKLAKEHNELASLH